MKSIAEYENSFTVASYETDFSGKMSLFNLFNRIQEYASIHAERLNVGFDVLREKRFAWVLSRIKVQINSMPGWGDKVTLKTWPKGIDRLFAMRDFCMTNENGETLLKATTAWLLINIDKMRPCRIETLPVNLTFTGAPDAIKDPLDKIPIPEKTEPAFEKLILLSDIDNNLHVNNAQYAKWAADCFTQEKFSNHTIKSVQINYLEETLLGDTVEIFKTPEDNSYSTSYIFGKSRGKGSVSFQAHLIWE